MFFCHRNYPPVVVLRPDSIKNGQVVLSIRFCSSFSLALTSIAFCTSLRYQENITLFASFVHTFIWTRWVRSLPNLFVIQLDDSIISFVRRFCQGVKGYYRSLQGRI